MFLKSISMNYNIKEHRNISLSNEISEEINNGENW